MENLVLSISNWQIESYDKKNRETCFLFSKNQVGRVFQPGLFLVQSISLSHDPHLYKQTRLRNIMQIFGSKIISMCLKGDCDPSLSSWTVGAHGMHFDQNFYKILNLISIYIFLNCRSLFQRRFQLSKVRHLIPNMDEQSTRLGVA